MCILDCRPKLSAVGNMAKGLGKYENSSLLSFFSFYHNLNENNVEYYCPNNTTGYEKPEGYSDYGCEITWLGIDNIHGNSFIFFLSFLSFLFSPASSLFSLHIFLPHRITIAMRDSLRNMYKLCLGSQSDHKWLSNLEYTR
jgi:hypothetical protein